MQGKSVAQEGERLAAKRPAGLLARLVAESDQAPVCTAMSACGRFAAVSTSDCTTLLAISDAVNELGQQDQQQDKEHSVAVIRTKEPLPAACCLCFVQCNNQQNQGNEEGASNHDLAGQGQCWLMLGCMNGELLCMHVDTTCDHALGPPVKVDLPEEDTLCKAASLKRSSSLASTHTT